jgi:streptogramin lyase
METHFKQILLKFSVFVVSLFIVLFNFLNISSSKAYAQETLSTSSFNLQAGVSDPLGITTGPDGNFWFTDCGVPAIGRITPQGSVNEFPLPIPDPDGPPCPFGITSGSDGNLWFTINGTNGANVIGRITTSGVTTEFPLPVNAETNRTNTPYAITRGLDGNMWFTESEGYIGRITPGGVITEFPLPGNESSYGITSGSDGNLWFTESNYIGRITTSGVITEFSLGTDIDKSSWDITTGPDGSLWFTELNGRQIGRITTAGNISEFSLSQATSENWPLGITSGPDGNLWFTEADSTGAIGDIIGKVNTSGVITEYSVSGFNFSPQNISYITSGQDGNLWFTAGNVSEIGRVNLNNVTPVSLAKSVVGANYLWGGKGWDYANNLYVDTSQIFSGYNYWNNDLQQTQFDNGLDCSGLIMWAYNKAFGAINYRTGNPIQYEGADGQFQYNSSPIQETDLQPGDLMFFDFEGTGLVDHVVMYVGDRGDGYDVVEAAQPGVGIIWAKKDVLKADAGFRGFKRQKDPQVGIRIKTHSPVTLTVTDPDNNTITPDTHRDTQFEKLREIPGQLYYTEDENLDDTVIAPILKAGVYYIKVQPKPTALSTDTYTLTVDAGGQTITLADHASIQSIPPQGYAIVSTGTTISQFIPVTIDNKTGGLPNTINPKDQGIVSVAVLSTDSLDATTIIPSTIRFGKSGTEATPVSSKIKDYNKDGKNDILLQFNIQDTHIACGDTQALLTGQTTNGFYLQGIESISTVGCGK